MVAAHKAALLAARPQLEMCPYTLNPGEYTGPDGERIIATTRELIFLDTAGRKGKHNQLYRKSAKRPLPRLSAPRVLV
jgi:hypothetical protein